MLKNKFLKALPRRRLDSHKGDYGRVLIIAGSVGMTGAGSLAARAALRSGAGLVYLAVPKELVLAVDALTPEVITLPQEKTAQVEADVVAMGPGLGQGAEVNKLVHNIGLNARVPLVLDADALNALAARPEMLKRAKTEIILTPHPGELSRLINTSINYIQNNRLTVAKETARRWHCLLVLKGHQTLVVNPQGEAYLNSTGNPGMATAGMGDVLTGMIAAFIAQGIKCQEAACLAVYLHGLAGDLAAKERGEYGLIASDVIEQIPYAIQKIC